MKTSSFTMTFINRINIFVTYSDCMMSVMRNFFSIVLVSLSFIANAQDQLGSIRGTVFDKNTGDPIPLANITLEGTKIGTSTDNNGFFSITRLQPGDYKLIIKVLGYDKFSKSFKIQPGKTINEKIFLEEMAIELGGVEITQEVQEAKEEVKISQVSVTPETIKKMPSIGGEPDIAQYLQVLPGVVSTGDQGGQLYIRGGAPIQNKVLLDGAIIYNPFHSIGLFSVFETDVIRNADVYTGGFAANFGGRISSIMDITTRDGNRKRFSGKFGVNTFTAKGIFEGPIVKLKENSKTTASFLLSVKGSYLEQSSKLFYPYADANGLPYNFYDIYGKISLYTGDMGSKINLFGFSYNDMVNFSDVTQLNWRANGGGLNFAFVPGQANVRIDGVISYSNYQMTMNEKVSGTRYSYVDGFNVNLNFHQFFGTNKITYGLEALGFKTQYKYELPFLNKSPEQTENTTEIAGFVRYKFNKWGFVFDPSFRLHYYASLNNVSAEPRLGIKYNIREWWRIKVAGGMYSQNLIAANSDRDVVNLFYGFLSGTDNLQDSLNGQQITSNLQKSQHAIAGMEFNITKYVTLNVEGYYMNFEQLINVNRNKIYDDNGENSFKPDYLKKDLIVENGYSAGLDATVKVEWKNLYLWFVYSFMKTERTDEVRTYSPHFDRRHNLNIVANYKAGKKKDWEFSARWNLGSGFPFTQTQGFYELIDFQNGINTDYTTANGNLGIQYGDINGGNLPWYHRLDINIKKTFQFGKNVKLELNAGATNTYNRENIFYIDRITSQRVNQLPILYNFGVNMEF